MPFKIAKSKSLIYSLKRRSSKIKPTKSKTLRKNRKNLSANNCKRRKCIKYIEVSTDTEGGSDSCEGFSFSGSDSFCCTNKKCKKLKKKLCKKYPSISFEDDSKNVFQLFFEFVCYIISFFIELLVGLFTLIMNIFCINASKTCSKPRNNHIDDFKKKKNKKKCMIPLDASSDNLRLRKNYGSSIFKKISKNSLVKYFENKSIISSYKPCLSYFGVKPTYGQSKFTNRSYVKYPSERLSGSNPTYNYDYATEATGRSLTSKQKTSPSKNHSERKSSYKSFKTDKVSSNRKSGSRSVKDEILENSVKPDSVMGTGTMETYVTGSKGSQSHRSSSSRRKTLENNEDFEQPQQPDFDLENDPASNQSTKSNSSEKEELSNEPSHSQSKIMFVALDTNFDASNNNYLRTKDDLYSHKCLNTKCDLTTEKNCGNLNYKSCFLKNSKSYTLPSNLIHTSQFDNFANNLAGINSSKCYSPTNEKLEESDTSELNVSHISKYFKKIYNPSTVEENKISLNPLHSFIKKPNNLEDIDTEDDTTNVRCPKDFLHKKRSPKKYKEKNFLRQRLNDLIENSRKKLRFQDPFQKLMKKENTKDFDEDTQMTSKVEKPKYFPSKSLDQDSSNSLSSDDYIYKYFSGQNPYLKKQKSFAAFEKKSNNVTFDDSYLTLKNNANNECLMKKDANNLLKPSNDFIGESTRSLNSNCTRCGKKTILKKNDLQLYSSSTVNTLENKKFPKKTCLKVSKDTFFKVFPSQNFENTKDGNSSLQKTVSNDDEKENPNDLELKGSKVYFKEQSPINFLGNTEKIESLIKTVDLCNITLE